jgi:hypothetical protein
MLLISALLVAPLAYAAADSASTQGIPLKVGGPQPRSEFYFKAESGAVFFRPPDKDNGNFSEATQFGPTNGLGSLGAQSGDDTTWSLGGTFGYYFPNQPTEAWMGKNLRIEVSGSYMNTTSNTKGADLSVSPSGNFVDVGRLDGNYTGTNQSTDIGSLSAGPNPVGSETLTTRDQMYQVGMAFRSDYIFDRGQLVVSPKLGFVYSHLDQNFHTSATGSRGTVDQQEDVTTDYFGPEFAAEVKLQLTKNLIYYAEGGIAPLYASSDYSGTQNGVSSRFGGGALGNSASDSKDDFAFKADFTTGFYWDFGPIILKLGGGFEYWNYVATVQEASIPSGTDTVGGAPVPFTIQPSHLSSSDMLNPTIKMTVVLPF